MKTALIALSLMMGIFGLSLDSHAYIVDFESLAHNDADVYPDHGATYLEGGFLFTNTATVENSGFAPSFSSLGAQDYGFTGSTALFNNNWEGQTVLNRSGGGTFDLNAISLAELMPADVQFSVLFTGLLANGSTVNQSFTLDGLNGAQNFSFGSGFGNLVAVSWNQTPDFHQFDNLDVTPTPIPAAAWLLGSGLMGLVGLRRRKHQ